MTDVTTFGSGFTTCTQTQLDRFTGGNRRTSWEFDVLVDGVRMLYGSGIRLLLELVARRRR